MTTKLHEVLAAEKTVTSAAHALQQETAVKFGKTDFFTGHSKYLKMINESPENAAIEKAARDERAMPTTVPATLDYMLDVWANAEDLLATKNKTNTRAMADVVFRGKTLLTDVPVDELMGLESRLEKLRNEVVMRIPTLDASKNWRKLDTDPAGVWTSDDVVTAKTQKIMYPVVMSPATDKHPAQVKEATRDEVVGTFHTIMKSGCATAVQKADMILAIDELIAEIKKARQRANAVDVEHVKVGQTIKSVLMACL